MIAAIEADLSEGNQLIYVVPGMMMTIGDFYRHVELSIQTRGYDTWQGGEANLLVTRSFTGRLSNTHNTGFAYRIERVTEFLVSNGVRAILGKAFSTQALQGGRWNIRPSRVVVPMEPTQLQSNTNYDGSISIQFQNYQAASSSRPPAFNNDDEEIMSENGTELIAMMMVEPIDDEDHDSNSF